MLIDFLFVFMAMVSAIFCAIKHHLSNLTNCVVPSTETTFRPGCLREIGRKYHICEITKHHYDEHKSKGPFCGFFVNLNPAAIITNLDLVENIMVNDFSNFRDRGLYYNEYHDPLSAHVFALKGAGWENLRKKLAPFFLPNKMESMVPMVLQVAQHFENLLDKLINANETDIEAKDVFGRYTMDVIGSCAFGIDCSTLHDENDQFVEMRRKFFDQPIEPVPMQLLISQFRSVARYLGLKKVPFTSLKFFSNGSTRYRQNTEVLRQEFINILMEIPKEKSDGVHSEFDLEDAEVAAQVFLFFLAGFETTTSLLTFCSHELAKNPEIQEKLRTQIQDVIRKHKGEITYEALIEMDFVDNVLYETLRKYPAVPIVNRITAHDYPVPNTNLIIPSGTTVIIPIYAIHRDADIYPQPLTFDSTRFEGDKQKDRHPMAFMPFGGGPRYCIGDRFAMMQARVALVVFLSNFRFSLSYKMPNTFVWSKRHTFLTNEGGIWLNIQRI